MFIDLRPFHEVSFHTTIERVKVRASQLCKFLFVPMALNPPQLLPPHLCSLSISSCPVSHSCQLPQRAQGPQLSDILRPLIPNTTLYISVSLLRPMNLPVSSLHILHISGVFIECSFNLLPRAIRTKTLLTLESLLPLLAVLNGGSFLSHRCDRCLPCLFQTIFFLFSLKIPSPPD